MANTAYDNNSIDRLEGAKRIRTRPASMLGTDGKDGARHGVIEIMGNAVDEHSAGYGDKVELHYYEDNSVSIRDYGRGVPIGWNDKKQDWNWRLIFAELYAGGKYNTYQDELEKFDNNNSWGTFNPQDYNYLFSIGLNGLGAASTQYTSEFFQVTSYRDGKASTMKFERGKPIIDDLIIEDTTEPNGTLIYWKPDDTVFTDTDLGSDFILDLATTTAQISQLTTHLIDDNTNIDRVIEAKGIETYFINDGIKEDNIFIINDLTHGHVKRSGNNNFIYVLKTGIALTPVKENATLHAFHNGVRMSSYQPKSAHLRGTMEALSDFFKQVSKKIGVRIKEAHYNDKISVIINSYSNTASYKGQTKDYVDDSFIELTIRHLILNELELQYAKGNPALLEMIDSIVEEIQLQEEAEELRRIARQATKVVKSNSKTTKHIDKFIPSRYYSQHKVPGSQLFIVEGDSAKGSVKDARNGGTQAIFPIRGKILNVLKAPMERIFANREVTDMINLIGGGMDLPEAEQMFNIDDVRFEDVIITTDADEDGYQIRMLVFLVFLRFMPEMIRQGRLYIAETPLFEMEYPDQKRYALNIEERDAIVKEHGNPRFMQRFKGLGQVPAQVLAETTIDPAYTKRKNLVQIKFDPTDPELYSIVDILAGKDSTKGRKEVILESLGADVANSISANNQLFDALGVEDMSSDLEVQQVTY